MYSFADFLEKHMITIILIILWSVLVLVIINEIMYMSEIDELTEQNEVLRDRVVEQNAQIESLQNKISIQEELE